MSTLSGACVALLKLGGEFAYWHTVYVHQYPFCADVAEAEPQPISVVPFHTTAVKWPTWQWALLLDGTQPAFDCWHPELSLGQLTTSDVHLFTAVAAFAAGAELDDAEA